MNKNNNDDLNVTFGCKPLEKYRNLTLREVGIVNGSTIFITSRLRGISNSGKRSSEVSNRIQEQTGEIGD